MKIDEILKNKWNDLYSHGDFTKIKAIMPEDKRVTIETIRRQFKSANYPNSDVLKAVAAYYKGKEIDLKDSLSMNNG